MQTTKQEDLKVLQGIPENANKEEMLYHLYILENIRLGQNDAAQGKMQSVKELLKDIRPW